MELKALNVVGYIEPDVTKPVDQNDETVRYLIKAFEEVVEGALGKDGFMAGDVYRGWHDVGDGKSSTNADYMLPCGLVTHSCLPHYVRWYRHQLSADDLDKVAYIVRCEKANEKGEGLPEAPAKFRHALSPGRTIWLSNTRVNVIHHAIPHEILENPQQSMGRGLM